SWHDLAARQRHHDGTHAPEDLGARSAAHTIAQSFEVFRRVHLVNEPPAHLTSGARAKKWLDVELTAERVPQFLTATVMDPVERCIGGETKGDGRKELQCSRFLFEISFERMVHVGDASGHRVEGFECTYERARRKHLNLDASASRNPDRLGNAHRTGV